MLAVESFDDYDQERAAQNHRSFLRKAEDQGWNAAMDLALTLSKEELTEIIAFSSLQIRALEWVLEAANVTPEDVADYASSMNRELLKDRLRRATKEAEDRLHDHPEDSGTPAKEGIDS